ncbi:MAG: amidohydrolase family protein [Candidatus Poribacteria bacterium]|nr:amidohydrolase family protein [Candidatus Poribacteria bacterium]
MLIDTHVHVGPLWDRYEPLTPKMMLDWMDDHEIEMAVPLPLESPEAASFYIPTRDMLALCREHPDRFIPFCVIDPRMSVSDGRNSFRKMIGAYVEEGAIGFGEVKVGLPVDHPLLQDIYAVCDELKLPLLWHIDNIRCTDTHDLQATEAMLKAFPNVKFIGHAPGFWSAISADVMPEERGGYPKRPVVPGGRVDELLTNYPNMYADLSAGSAHGAITRDWEFGQKFLERQRDKLLFATDYLYIGQDVPQFDMWEAADISDEARRKIGYENAKSLFRL